MRLRSLVASGVALVAPACAPSVVDLHPRTDPDTDTEPVLLEDPIAVAEGPRFVSEGFTVILDGSASEDPEGGVLTYTWTQTRGPDVTGGVGTLTGSSPFFSAPYTITTVVFELVVSADGRESEPVPVTVTVLEDVDAALFVDGDEGSDESGDGSPEHPFGTLDMALALVRGDGSGTGVDIYVRSTESAYVVTGSGNLPDTSFEVEDCASEAAFRVPDGTSVHGGFSADWTLPPQAVPSLFETDRCGVWIPELTQRVKLSRLEVHASGAFTPDRDVYGLRAVGAVAEGARVGDLTVEDCVFLVGDVEPTVGLTERPGDAYGLFFARLGAVEVRRSTVDVGSGGSAAAAVPFAAPASGHPHAGGSGGGGTVWPVRGHGGRAGSGPRGGRGGGGHGRGADGGHGDRGSNGGGGDSFGAASLRGYEGSAGSSGGAGQHGSGGGGGGGGNEAFRNGPRGGRGGSGGSGGAGGRAGQAGGGSIGVFLHDLTDVWLEDIDVTTGDGGRGGAGTLGQAGNAGTSGASAGGNAGGGGNGGNGGRGGSGGSGGGGASYGIYVGSGVAPHITRPWVATGTGGDAAGNCADCGSLRIAEGGASFGLFDADLHDGADWLPLDATVLLGFAGENGDGGFNTHYGARNFE